MGDDQRLDAALIALRQILQATEINSRALAKSSGLTASQHIVLQVLATESGLTQAALAQRASLSQATVTTLLEKMGARGLIDRQRDACDKRRVLVKITEEGQRTLDAAPSLLQARFAKRFAMLEDWEKAFLVAALERTVTLFDAGEIDAAPYLEIGQIGAP